MLKRIAILSMISALLMACATTSTQSGAVRIDSRTEKSAEASYKTMMKSLPESKRQKLATAVLTLNMEGVKSAQEVVNNPELQSPSIGRIKDKVAGLTADEIMALAARVSDIRIEVSGQ
jgi:type IV pilus biogenesis protein CpaD/CtpE